jgi:hypothetical protein
MNNYKKFIVLNRNDYLIYLRQIIVTLNKHFKSLEKYIIDLENIIGELKLEEVPNQPVDAYIYEEFRDKTQYIEKKILNLLGDMQGDSISYNKFKRTLVKRNIEVKQLIGKIPQQLSELLNEMNINRNWGLHEPESLLNAHLENIKELWPKEEVDLYLNNFTPIQVPIFEKYEGKWVMSLYKSCKGNLDYYKSIYEYILIDYKILSAKEEIEIKFNKIIERPFESEIQLPMTSFKMQRNQYKSK